MTVSTRSASDYSDDTRQKKNKRLADRRKLRHQERCQRFRDEQLYYESSVLVNTLEGQIIKDIEEIQSSSSSTETKQPVEEPTTKNTESSESEYYFSFIPKSLFWW
jgi:hypothetical protein